MEDTKTTLGWQDKELQQAQNLIDSLESFSYLKFLIQVIGVVFFANIFSSLFSVPWFFDIVTLNTIFMTMSCFSMRIFLQRELYRLIHKKSLQECLLADTELLHGDIESLTRYKMQQLQSQAGSYKKYRQLLSLEIKKICASHALQNYEQSSILKLLYQQMKMLQRDRPYSSFLYRFFTRQKQLNIATSDLKELWNGALQTGNNQLLMKIIFDVQYGALSFDSEFATSDDLFNYLSRGNAKRLQELLGTQNLKDLSLPPTTTPANRFVLLDNLAQISYIINFSLIEPVRDLQERLQNYHQAGATLFASAFFMSMPIGLLLGFIAIIAVVSQSLNLSIYFLASRRSLQAIIDAYASQPQAHYERLLQIKLTKLLRAHQTKPDKLPPINCQHLSEIQRFKVYEMIIDAHAQVMPQYGAHRYQQIDVTAILPFLIQPLTQKQRSLYLSKLRPISQSHYQQLQSSLDKQYTIPIQKTLKKQKEEQRLLAEKIADIDKSFEVFLSELALAPTSRESLLDCWEKQQRAQEDGLTQQQQAIYESFLIKKSSLTKQVEDLAPLYQQLRSVKQLSNELSLIPIVADWPLSDKQYLYQQLCQIRNRRDAMMSYVFPLNTITNSALGVLFYFLPALLVLGVMTYTVAPAVLLAFAAFSIFAAYHYFKARENKILDSLHLGDFWGQQKNPTHLKVLRQKIKRLGKYGTPEIIHTELLSLVKKISQTPMQEPERQLLAQILPKLKEISTQKASKTSALLIQDLSAFLSNRSLEEKCANNTALPSSKIESELANVGQLLQQNPPSELREPISLLSHTVKKQPAQDQKLGDKKTETHSETDKSCALEQAKKINRAKDKIIDKQSVNGTKN